MCRIHTCLCVFCTRRLGQTVTALMHFYGRLGVQNAHIFVCILQTLIRPDGNGINAIVRSPWCAEYIQICVYSAHPIRPDGTVITSICTLALVCRIHTNMCILHTLLGRTVPSLHAFVRSPWCAEYTSMYVFYTPH